MKKFFFFLFLSFYSSLALAQTSLQQCQSESCLRQFVPYNLKNPPSFDSCKSLEGKKAKEDFDEDLGVLCRLVISRALAGNRASEPCKFENDPNPDFQMNLDDSLRPYYNRVLLEPYLTKGTVGPLSYTGGYNGSTIHGSYVYDLQTSEDEGLKRSVSFASYFCISDIPKTHYVPYFTVLKIDNKVVDQNYVSTPPTLEPVLLQLPKDMHPDNPMMMQLIDMNGDGKKDVVLFFRDFIKGYAVNVCLYQVGQPSCKPVVSKVLVNGMYSIPKKMSVNGKLVKIEFEKDGKQFGEAVFEYTDTEMKLLKKVGFKEN